MTGSEGKGVIKHVKMRFFEFLEAHVSKNLRKVIFRFCEKTFLCFASSKNQNIRT